MSFFNIIFVIMILCAFGLMFYSVIRWLAIILVSRKDKERRKKYAIMCACAMAFIVCSMMISFIINLKRNMM